MKSILTALGFFTIIPVPSSLCRNDHFGRIVPFIPFVGLLLGGLGYAFSLLLLKAVPPGIAAAIMAIYFSFISGCLHLDGLADTFDGFWSSRPKERILEIMRDSRIGTMGVFAIISILLVKYAACFGVGPVALPLACFVAPVAGRCGMTFSISISGYAREDGLAKMFFEANKILPALISLVVLSAASFLLFSFYGIFLALGIFFFVTFWKMYCSRKIGGATGDTLGACCEICEALAIICIAAQPFVMGYLNE